MITNELLETETILIKEEFKDADDTKDLWDYLPQAPSNPSKTTVTAVSTPSICQIKCGEIFIINKKLNYVCYFCDYIEKDSENFENHIFVEHYILNKNNIVQIGNECNKPKNAIGEEVNDHKNPITLTKPPIKEENDPLTSGNLFNFDLLNNSILVDNNKTNCETNKLLVEEPTVKFICEFCERTFDTHSQIKNHLKHFRKQQNICTICNKKICGIKYLKLHQKFTHNLNNNGKIKPSDKLNPPNNKTQTICNYCDKDLLTNLKLRRHIALFRNHQNVCTICQQQTCGFKQFMKHMSSVHDIENIQPPSLLKHPLRKQIKYIAKKEYFCDFCKFVCKDLSNFNAHKRTHTGERPFVCKYCNKSFIQNSEKKLHERKLHTGEKPFQCSECGMCFPFLRILNKHISIAHLKHERITAKCTICTKVLASEKNLKKHMIDVHRNDRPFQCNICEKSFKTQKILFDHKKIHSVKKSYECNYCDQTFFQSSGRRGHIRRVHENKEICNGK